MTGWGDHGGHVLCFFSCELCVVFGVQLQLVVENLSLDSGFQIKTLLK